MKNKAELLKFAETLNNLLPEILKEFHRRQPNELYKDDITLQQFSALSFLNAQDNATMGGIAKN